MKNRSNIETILLEHLRDAPNGGKTILLTGTWGCGKTYLWREKILPQFENEKPVSVSLFGIDSVASLKTSLMNECLLRKLSNVKDKDWKEVRKNLRQLLSAGFRKGIDALLSMDILSSHIDPIQLIDDGLLICLDDVERVSRDVPLEEILGIANMLAEVKKARVVLIMNESQLVERPNDEAIMKRFKERVFTAHINVDADLESIFDELAKRHIGNKNTYKALTQHRNTILNIFERSKSTNLRTVGRLIQSIAYLCKNLNPDFLTDERIAFLTVMSIEAEKGTLRDKSFYQFSELSLMFLAGDKLEPEAKEQLDFYRLYFGNERTRSYSYSDALYCYIKNGYLDISYATNEFAPPKIEGEVVRSLLAETQDEDFFYYSDAQYSQFIDSACAIILSDSDINTYQLILLVAYMALGAARANLRLPRDIYTKFTARLSENAAKCDDSFGHVARMQLGATHVLWEQLVETYYDQQLRAAKDKELNEKITSLVDNHDTLGFVREVRQRPNSLELCMIQSIFAKIISTWKTNRHFQISAISIIGDELEAYDVSLYPQLQSHRKRFASALASLLADPTLDNADKYRISIIFAKYKTWQ